MPAGKTTEKTICCIYPRAEHGVGRTLHCMENPRMENHCIDCRKPMYGNQCMKNQCMENQCKKLQKYGKPMYLLSFFSTSPNYIYCGERTIIGAYLYDCEYTIKKPPLPASLYSS